MEDVRGRLPLAITEIFESSTSFWSSSLPSSILNAIKKVFESVAAPPFSFFVPSSRDSFQVRFCVNVSVIFYCSCMCWIKVDIWLLLYRLRVLCVHV